MNFRLWLEEDAYGSWRPMIQGIFRGSFPFRYMFPQDRIYIPFAMQGQVSETQQEIAKAIADAGFTITDWRKGFAQKAGDKRIYKISKILRDLERKDLSDLEDDYARGQVSAIKHKASILSSRRYYTDLNKEFQNDPSRLKKDGLTVVMSCDPHDLASMSTGRGWKSCMELGKGEYYKDVFCEVKEGGFIAYLIFSEDKRIEKPIARIHIRRFVNKKGVSVAVPEQTVYGQDIPGFYEKVKEWIDTKQGPIVGQYKRMGGGYSDTFSGDRMVIFDPTDSKTIKHWIQKWIAMPDGLKHSKIKYFHSAISAFLQSKEQWTKNFLEKVRDALFSYQDTLMAGWLGRFAVKYPNLISKEQFKKLYPLVQKSIDTNLSDNLLRIFAKYLDEDMLKQIGKYQREKVTKANPELAPVNQRLVQQDILTNFHVANPNFSVDERVPGSMYGVQGKISDMLYGVGQFKPIPEPMVRKLIEFSNNVDKLNLLEPKQNPNDDKTKYEVSKVRNSIIGYIINAFDSTETDSPSVQRFYQSLLPKWKELGGIGLFGHAMAKLGGNGKQFLPFIKQKMKEFEQAENVSERLNWEQAKEEALENFRWVIDAIESGKGHSTKYDFSYGVSADAWEPRKFPWS